MQQLGFHGMVSAHGERHLPLWTGQAPGALNQLAAQGAELFESPQRCAFCGRVAFLLITEHLHLPVEIVRQHRREQVDLVAGLFSGGDVVHLCLRLEFSENALLGATPIVESQRFPGGDSFVGDDRLEVVAIFIGGEKIQLHRALVLFSVPASDKYEAVSVIPARWLPVRFKEAAFPVEVAPAFAAFDQCLEGGKALERDADRELNTFGIKHGDDVIAEKGAVHARLNDAARQNRLDFPHAGEDEYLGAIGIVYVTGAMPDIEDLSSLGDGAKQRVVAALTFLLPIETDGCAFGETASRNNGAVEVQRDAGKSQPAKLIQNPLPDKPTQVADTSVIQSRQRPADGGDIWQALQSQQAMHHGIILVIAHILKPAVAQQQMNDQQRHHDAMTKNRADRQVAETSAQLLLQVDAGKQRLVQYKARERGQSLILEPDLWNTIGFAMNGGFATLHADGLRWYCWSVWRLQFYQLRGRFFMHASHLLASIYAVFWTSLLVRSSNNRATGGSHCIQAVSLKYSAGFMQLSGLLSSQ